MKGKIAAGRDTGAPRAVTEDGRLFVGKQIFDPHVERLCELQERPQRRVALHAENLGNPTAREPGEVGELVDRPRLTRHLPLDATGDLATEGVQARHPRIMLTREGSSAPIYEQLTDQGLAMLSALNQRGQKSGGTMTTILSAIGLAVLLAASGCGSPCGGSGTAMNGAACTTTADCCSPNGANPTAELTCSRMGHTCRPASDLPLGEPATHPAQCASSDWDYNYGACTAPCTSDTNCNNSTACVKSLGVAECLSICASTADCSVYIQQGGTPSLSCMPVTSLSGKAVKVCGFVGMSL